jgi:hypothetical protein
MTAIYMWNENFAHAEFCTMPQYRFQSRRDRAMLEAIRPKLAFTGRRSMTKP